MKKEGDIGRIPHEVFHEINQEISKIYKILKETIDINYGTELPDFKISFIRAALVNLLIDVNIGLMSNNEYSIDEIQSLEILIILLQNTLEIKQSAKNKN